MKVTGRVFVITVGAAGIGRAMAARFIADVARHVTIVDLDAESVAKSARAGLTEVALRLHDDPMDGLRIIGEHVLPALRH